MGTHRIEAGETLWALTQQYGCTLDALFAANPGINAHNLQIGQIVNIPNTQGSHSSPSNTGGWTPPGGPLLPTGQAPPHARLDRTLSPHASSPIGQLRHWIDPAAQATGVPADLIGAVIYQESGGNIHVNSTVNQGNIGLDSGVMQVNQHTADEVQRKYPERFVGLSGVAKDVMLGASYLKEMYDTVADHDWGITLRAYNSGPNGVNKNNLRDRPAGTGDSTYVDKVFRFWSDISQGHPLPADHYASIYGHGF